MDEVNQYQKHVFICEMGGSCSGRGAEGMGDALVEIITERGLEGKVKLTKTACIGACGFGPNVVVYPDGIWYYGVTKGDLSRIIDETVVGGRTIDEMVFHKHGDPTVVEVVKDPVCGMIFRVNQAFCFEVTPERTVYFCCEGCRKAYLADPAAYAPKKHGHGHKTTDDHSSHSHGGHHGH